SLSLVLIRSVQVYGQGSGLECRRHVQKLNLLQGEAEEALGWTSWCVEDSVNDSKNRAAQREDSSVQQEGRTEGSRWSKYLDQEGEDQEDDEEEAALEWQQFSSQRKNSVGEQRKHPKRFLSSDVPEHAEESGVSQLVYQAKKHKKCFVAVPDGHDGDADSGGGVVPAVCESVVPEENTQPPAACTKPSKWGKFLSSSDNSSENAAAVTMALQAGSGGLGLDSTAAGGAQRCLGQAQRTVSQGTGLEFKKCVASTEDLASRRHSSSCSAEDALREPHSQVLRAASSADTTAGRCCLDTTGRANTLINSNPGPKLSNIAHEQLFCTGEDFDDDL
ncbi:MRNIP protein, partial [Callaeas wilsoni]|nr:MRNIP protein [Callaeas wilsoni]